MSDLQVERLEKRFASGGVEAVSFDVPAGKFFSILGPSGCGKTTLLRMIAGFQTPDSGTVRIGGADMHGVPAHRRPTNLVFQTLALFPMMSVGDNIAYGLKCRGEARDGVRKKVAMILERMHLPGFETRRIDELSGGQRQRVALARCLVLEPALLLLDEPLGALDLKLREEMKIELKQLQNNFRTTFVYITHDQSEALALSDIVAVMNKGRFEQIGTPEQLYHAPATPFVARFVGENNHFEATVADSRHVQLPGWGVVGADFTLPGPRVEAFVRPETVQLGLMETDLGHLPIRLQGVVQTRLFDGAQSRVIVARSFDGSEGIRAALPMTGPMTGLERGSMVWLGWNPKDMTLLSPVVQC